MKKTLIALAAVAATGAAFAQSSVTLYGVADIAVGDTNAKTVTGANADSIRALASSPLNNGNSRIGFRGVEDLGGGLKAGFNFEQNVSLADGSTGNGTTTALSTDVDTFQRAANLFVSGGFGEVRLGRQLTTSFHSVTAWELTGAANYSVVASQFGFAGAGSRDDALIRYISPAFGGFTVSAATVLKGNDANSAVAGEQNKYDLAATYTAGPIAASIAYNKVQRGNEGMALGGRYDFGMFKVAASYHNNENTTGQIRSEGFTVGAGATLGPVALTLDVARDTEFKDTNWVLEAKYPLSKRTFVYGVVTEDGKRAAKAATASNVAATAAPSVRGFALGVRHNF